MNSSTEIHLNLRRHNENVDERIYGGFLEHLGRAVYEGAYQPSHPTADENGFRRDVIEALRPIGFSIMRYPGGNFVSAYDWKDGIGPKESRPRRLDFAWRSIETNQFGTDEFMAWCREIGTEPMLAVNLGTGQPRGAAELLEYCNLPRGTSWADLRAQDEPYGVKLWCLGNEMDGPWQAGQRPAKDYASSALQASRLMKGLDPTIETIVCGSSGRGMPDYMDWDLQVLDTCFSSVDYISAHRYTQKGKMSTWDYLAEGLEIDRIIQDYRSLIGYVRAKYKSDKQIHLSFDEWNVWYREMSGDGDWKEAPHLLEEVYNWEDALIAAQYLSSFVRNSDVVKVACLAQAVNVIAPVLTREEGVLTQSIAHPLSLFRGYGVGTSLQAVTLQDSSPGRGFASVPHVDVCAVAASGQVNVFLTHRSDHGSTKTVIDLRPCTISGAKGICVAEAADTANTWETPNAISQRELAVQVLDSHKVELTLPPLAFAVVQLAI
ncbi:MAG: hypothetical protein MUC92_03325 [Fimbriimonadaceae bacterium]|jgi:alpha-N-arabinofuranosidase|nr:hypothetical protein [Fimbriimonadaceae bacterium]